MPFTALRPTLLGALTPAMALLLGLAPHGAEALGLGRPQIQSALGKPLDASIPLTLADGESLGDSCLRAEVTAGDARVPAGLLQLHVEGEPGQQRIRLQSLVPIEEPTLRITLALGCPLRLTREFSAIIDPPAGAIASQPAPPAPPLPPLPQLAAVEPAPRALLEARPAAPRHRPQAHARARTHGPRLVLERPEVLASQATPQPAPASAPETEMTPELEAQISQLEQTVAQLRAELGARQAQAASAVAAPAPASEPVAPRPAPVVAAAAAHAPAYRDPLNWLMTLALSLLAGSAAFYGSRWLDLRARRQNAYWRSLQAAAEGAAPPPAPAHAAGMAPPVEVAYAAPLPDEGQHAATRPQPRPMAWPPPQIVPIAPPAPVLSELAMMATQPLPARPAAVAQPQAPELTLADELLDLQQQVDFLLLLGQHEAAADLLANRLAHGSSSAMPYLMLMELCQQRGEPEVFAELATQFEQRLHVPAPSWSQSLARGRSLDGCTSVIAHLQVVWSEPGAAMQMLQTLLAKGGGPGVPSFDLPSYRDLLTLYSVARDLFEAGLRGDDVDVMLPIDSRFDRA